MRYKILTILLILLPGQIPASEEQIRAAEKAWAAAVTAGDHAAVDRMLADQLIYAHASGGVENKSEYLGKLRSGQQKYDAIEHQSMTFRVHGDAAVAHGKVRMTGKTRGQPFDNQVMMLHLWVRQGGQWRLAAHQTTRLP